MTTKRLLQGKKTIDEREEEWEKRYVEDQQFADKKYHEFCIYEAYPDGRGESEMRKIVGELARRGGSTCWRMAIFLSDYLSGADEDDDSADQDIITTVSQ